MKVRTRLSKQYRDAEVMVPQTGECNPKSDIYESTGNTASLQDRWISYLGDGKLYTGNS